MKFSELVRLLETNGFKIVKEKRFNKILWKAWMGQTHPSCYHGPKEVPKGTCHAILKAAGIKEK